MAVVKKTVAPVAAKVEAPKAEVKKAAPTTPVKTETKTAVKEAEKAPVAKAEEKAVNNLFVTTVFVGTPEGKEIIRDIEGTYRETGCADRLVIVGSIIASQAYPGKVVGLCPVPGFERVTPSEKRMRCDKFTVFTENEV